LSRNAGVNRASPIGTQDLFGFDIEALSEFAEGTTLNLAFRDDMRRDLDVAMIGVVQDRRIQSCCSTAQMNM
jgi:hypothetical protein